MPTTHTWNPLHQKYTRRAEKPCCIICPFCVRWTHAVIQLPQLQGIQLQYPVGLCTLCIKYGRHCAYYDGTVRICLSQTTYGNWRRYQFGIYTNLCTPRSSLPYTPGWEGHAGWLYNQPSTRPIRPTGDTPADCAVHFNNSCNSCMASVVSDLLCYGSLAYRRDSTGEWPRFIVFVNTFFGVRFNTQPYGLLLQDVTGTCRAV